MRSILVTALILLVTAEPATFASTTFTATINGASNVPALAVPGTGAGTFVLNDAQTQLSYNIHFSGLLADEIAAHIHNAGARDNGPAVFGLPLGSPKIGVWSIPAAMVTELFASHLYVNIHSSLYVLGEIRGQIRLEVLPVEGATWGAVKALYR